VKPRARRLAAWNSPLMASRKPLVWREVGTKEFQTVSESLWEVRLTHGWLIDAVLDGLELASARLSCRDSAGPVGSIGARCV
jgi:hypothetical protein